MLPKNKKTVCNKQPKVKKKKAKSRWVLVRELDMWFSKFIRLRDADKNGICSCITCWTKIHRKQMHNCHYIERWNYRYRRGENNCNAGCNACNTYHKEAHKRKYTMYMVAKYWLETVMQREATKRENANWKTFEIQDMIDYYKAKVKDHPLYW